MPTRINPSMAAVIVAFVAGMTVLIALGRDPAMIISFANTCGVALLYAQTQTIKEQTNGTTHRLMNIVESNSTPPSSVPSSAPEPPTTKAKTL